jgi:hypothetical protein
VWNKADAVVVASPILVGVEEMHNFKLLSPAKVMEWMMADGLPHL